jgi:adenine-specific DNA glycosylase
VGRRDHAQQTQVQTAIPYYTAFLRRFPTIAALAAAPLGEVLRQWAGLGYYARARESARRRAQVVAEHAGGCPTTAPRCAGCRASASTPPPRSPASPSAGPRPPPTATSSGCSRGSYALAVDVRAPAARALLWALARAQAAAAPPGRAGEYNAALMDLGATICTPRAPQCAACPLRRLCAAQRAGRQDEIPLRVKRARAPHVDVTAGVIWRRGRVLIAQRPADKLLGGLWEFPGGKVEPGETLAECLARELRELGIRRHHRRRSSRWPRLQPLPHHPARLRLPSRRRPAEARTSPTRSGRTSSAATPAPTARSRRWSPAARRARPDFRGRPDQRDARFPTRQHRPYAAQRPPARRLSIIRGCPPTSPSSAWKCTPSC